MSDRQDDRQDDWQEELRRARRSLGSRSASSPHARLPGVSAAEVHLVVVTKTFPATDVRLLVGLGVTDVAENKQQELAAKHAELASEVPVRWHFVGRLQSNKAGPVADDADVVHSLDRAKLIAPMDRRGRELDVLLQVSLDPPGAPHRSGASPETLLALADDVVASEHLRLRGLMAVAPLGEDPADGVREARRDPGRFPGGAPLGDLAVRRHERRSRARDQGRRDTRACRLRGPRIEALGPVAFETT